MQRPENFRKALQVRIERRGRVLRPYRREADGCCDRE
jgi:hypothetical protein